MELPEDIKLVIWDLDNTFWKGSIGENEDISIINGNVKIVKLLTDRGIINSIVSKNNYDIVKKKLEEIGIWDYFVLPQINFNSKGIVIKQLLEILHIRPINTLFIDDNITNLKEAQYYNSNLNVVLSNDKTCMLHDKHLMGKPDNEHKKLELYKIIETKYFEELTFDDNLKFLRLSDIMIFFKYDLYNHIDRLFELSNKTNQLNYTKRRYLNKQLLLNDFNNLEYKTEYILARDKYGFYGTIGFYTIHKLTNVLINFVFSCRILGTCIDNFVYNYLGCPYIKVVGDVSNELKKENIDWVLLANDESNIKFNDQTLNDDMVKDLFVKEENKKLTCLCIGGCDIQAIKQYIHNQINIVKCLKPIKLGNTKLNDLSIFNLYNCTLPGFKQKYILLCLSYSNKPDNIFLNELFNINADIVILSLLNSYNPYLYLSYKYPDIVISGKADLNINDDFIHISLNDNTFIFKDKLLFILQEINKNSPKKIFLLNAPNILEFTLPCTKELNNIVNEVSNEFNNVTVIDVNKYISSYKDIKGFNVKHYTRIIYYKIAKEIIDNINKIS